MKKRELGNSGMFVSELGLGCMSLPENPTEAKNIIDAAFEADINFFDTADLYASGNNESIVGEALKGRRDKVILSTKVGNRRIPGQDGWTWDPSKHHIIEAVKGSLKRLGTDYIDLYQLHGGTMEDDADEVIDAFDSLKKEGLIRQYGISSIRPNVIRRFLEKSTAVSVMMQYSMLDRRPEEWFSSIQKHNTSILTRGTLAKGLLTAEGIGRLKKANGFAEFGNVELQETLKIIHHQFEDVHASAIAFNLHNEAVASAIVGASSTGQLLDSIIAYEKNVDSKMLDDISAALVIHQYTEHRP
ncbi:aldo/keto reductase [Sporosarcina oncorhynchi]|uniref:Aldo/keto reductase n=1 Tax=Sporosarcina oncorhynchi TaxID=3056444 RepID=A0ABZ0L304_9BACL|nr:aldo/keto reductase [Sporosarcina sp. T2O-4]WOV86022.1 aldo/keto reductase [Sporosarcina sp. T2O-4]